MQRPDEKKRELIAAIAARMFSTRPYHEVLLDDVAAEAKISKGTVYTYFKSKDDLYASLIDRGFAGMVDRLTAQLDACDGPTQEAIRIIIDELVGFAVEHPDLFEIVRSAGGIKPSSCRSHKYAQLTQLIERTIRRGIRRGELTDPHPEITAVCIPGLVRSIFLFGPKGLKRQRVVKQLVRLLELGISAGRQT